jgi:hypothetical protein
MHMSPETFNKIASLLQADARAFKAKQLEESIKFSKNKNSTYAMTLDSMGIGTLEVVGESFVFTSRSSLGEKFNGAIFKTLIECKKEILAFMLGEKKEAIVLDEEVAAPVEELDESADIKKEYDTLKKMAIADLKAMYQRSHRISDVSGMSKDSLVTGILRSKHGDKRFAAAMGLKEEVEELEEGQFSYHMKKALDAKERGDEKKKQYHLSNAKTARYAMKSTEITKNKELLDTYSKMVTESEQLDEKYNEDDHVIMQLRKAQDVDGKLDIKFHSGPAGRLTPEQITKILTVYDKLNPEGKRRMRLLMKTHKSTVEMLKEEVYNGIEEVLNESTLSKMRDVEIVDFYKKLKNIKGMGDLVAEFKKEMVKRNLKEEAIEEASYEKDLDPNKKIVVKGVKGMKSRPFKKTFANMKAYDKWADSPAAEDVDVHQVMNESVIVEQTVKIKLPSGKVISAVVGDVDSFNDSEFMVTVDSKDLDRPGPQRKIGMKVKKTQVVKEENEELAEGMDTEPFFLDPKTRKPMSPKDEVKAIQGWLKDARSDRNTPSHQKIYQAERRLQYLSARLKEEVEEIDEGIGLKFDKQNFKAWKAQAEKMGYRVRDAVDYDGDSGNMWTASDKQGNHKGEWHKKKGGYLKEEKDVDKDEEKPAKKKKKGDKEELDMEPKKMLETFKNLLNKRLDEAYKIYHPTYSAAVAEALAVVKKAGLSVDEDDFFNKITSGPRKPTPGKTNIASIALVGSKKQLHMQVYNTGKSFELNCYIQ